MYNQRFRTVCQISYSNVLFCIFIRTETQIHIFGGTIKVLKQIRNMIQFYIELILGKSRKLL